MKKINGLIEIIKELYGVKLTPHGSAIIENKVAEQFSVVTSLVNVPKSRKGQKAIVDYKALARRQAIFSIAEHLIDNGLVEEVFEKLEFPDKEYFAERARYTLTVLK